MYVFRIIFVAHLIKLTNRKMKKITFALAACAALTFAACGNNATETTNSDSTQNDSTLAPVNSDSDVEGDTSSMGTQDTSSNPNGESAE